MISPSNLVASNNIVTCNVFCNETVKAVQLLESLFQKDPHHNINEQIIQNIMSMYDVSSPEPKVLKQKLVEFCAEKAKEGVNAALLISGNKNLAQS